MQIPRPDYNVNENNIKQLLKFYFPDREYKEEEVSEIFRIVNRDFYKDLRMSHLEEICAKMQTTQISIITKYHTSELTSSMILWFGMEAKVKGFYDPYYKSFKRQDLVIELTKALKG